MRRLPKAQAQQIETAECRGNIFDLHLAQIYVNSWLMSGLHM